MVISDQIDPMSQLSDQIDPMSQQNTALFRNFSQKRGGRGSLIPKTGCKNVTQNVIFCENQKCSLWPKMQNKH